MKLRKLCAFLVALTMILSVFPAVSVSAEDEMTTAFDAAALTITGEQEISTAGWTATEKGGSVRWNQNWGNNGVWGTQGTYALMFFFTNQRGNDDSLNANVSATFDNSKETARADKLEITFNFACQVSDNIYQRWHFLDNDDKEFATFYFDKNEYVSVADPEVKFLEGKDKAYEFRGKEVKITAEKNADGKYTVTYTADGKVITTKTLDSVNGFKAVTADIPKWNDTNAAAGLQNLKIAYVPGEGKADVKLVLSAGGQKIEKSIKGLFDGDSYTPSEEEAPLQLDIGGELYIRDKVTPFDIKAGENTLTVTYTKATVASVEAVTGDFAAIAGNMPAFPKTVTGKTTDGTNVKLDAEWSTKTDVDALTEETKVTYTASVIGYDKEVSAQATIYPCDHAIGTPENPTFWHGGDNSDNANFGNNNPLGYVYGGGTMINEYDFTLGSGENKLIMYGSVDNAGDRFGGMAALIRFFQKDSGGYIEYYNGNWARSGILAKRNTPYRLKTVIDVTNKRYSAYISEDGGAYQTVCVNAAFRNQNASKIDRMFMSGAMTSSMHRSYWKNGYSVVTVTRKISDGTVIGSYTTKHATGTKYVYTDAQPIIEKDGKLYMRENNSENPSVEVNGEKEELVITYNPVEAESVESAEASLVQGDSTINLPAQLKVTFSDGQTLKYAVTWNTENVDVNTADDYNVTGVIAELGNMEAKGVVHVKAINNLEKRTENTVATNNGGWNWYVEPSGTHIQQGDGMATLFEGGDTDIDGKTITYASNNGYQFKEDKTYMGWVEDGGNIVIAEYNHNTDEYKRVVIHEKLESDDHNNPAVVVLPDGRIMAVYSMHTNEAYMYYRVTKNPEDISEWNKEQYYHCQSVTPDDTDVYHATYPSVFMVHDDMGQEGNDVIYMGWRGVHWKPTLAKFSMPDENGVCETLMHQTQFANTTYGYSTYDGADAPNAKADGGRTDSGRRPYTKYDYDYKKNRIYITFTANHPDNDKRNHIFYLYFDINDQNLYTAKDRLLQPLPFENQQSYRTQGAVVNGVHTNGQWGVLTADLVGEYPELLVFDASEQTGESFNPRNGNVERRGWTWDISHNEKGEPCIVYVDITATPPGENGELPTWYKAEENGNTRSHHYYWYARWDSETQTWVKTFLTYGGKWWHENATQERCYSGGLTFDHNAKDANVIFLSIPTMGKYGNMFEIYRWESDDHGATWTTREPITQDSKACNARPNAIYNYKMNPDGTNAGPRLLWKQGEYRYWMNYEYKTGVNTDFAAPGFITQDDPEMFADAALYGADGEKLDKLPVGQNTVIAKFNVTNISIGDGKIMVGLAHYNSEGALVKVVTDEADVPSRSVPQTGILGAPLRADGSLSRMGDPEVTPKLEYSADFKEGDRVTLLAWNAGIEHPMSSIMDVPFDMTTDGDKFIFKETFTYEGDDRLMLDSDKSTFNGWVGNRYYDGSAQECVNDCYAGIIKAPFGNTALHLYHKGDGGVMASHELPDTNGKDFELNFTIRYINEWSWNNTANAGFTLSNGIPGYANDIEHSNAAFQFRHGVQWQDENGRGTNGYVRRTRWFDGSGLEWIFHGGIPRYMDTEGMERVDYDKGEGYYDPETETYIHDYNDSLMVGSLYRFKVVVSPSKKTVVTSINDGYRTVSFTESFVDSTTFDWDSHPINAITFNVGNDKWGEMYVDDISMQILE